MLNGKRMIDRYEQVDFFSENEYRRRQALVRDVMKKNDVDLALILFASQDAFDQWLTGRRLLEELIVPAEGEITGVLLGDYDPSIFIDYLSESENPDSQRAVFRPAEKPSAPDTVLVDAMTGPQLASYIARYAPKRVGLINPDAMTIPLRDSLQAALPSCEWVDITQEMSLKKVIKSEEEISAIHTSNLIHERIMQAMPQVLRQGRYIFDIQNEITDMLHQLGSGNTLVHHWIIMAGDQTGESDPSITMEPWPGYRLKAGDRAMILLESNGPGGHHVAIARHFTLGPACEEYRRIVDVAAQAQAFAASQMQPGQNLREIARKTCEFIESTGYVSCDQNFMHGLGLTYFEPYSLNHWSETIPLEENVFLHAHPIVRTFLHDETHTYRYESFVLDTFLVKPGGAVRTTSLPHNIIEIE